MAKQANVQNLLCRGFLHYALRKLEVLMPQCNAEEDIAILNTTGRVNPQNPL
jgi:hypothetical protein